MRRPLLLALVAALPLSAQSPFDALKFRSIGPAVMGGRIQDVEVDPRDPSTIYVGAAAGGIWKTTNHGTTWAPIFDGQADNSFGDIAVFAGDSKIIWAGTGEQNNRQSSTWGGGVYRSTDAGATWTFVGLRESGSIGRVLLHPTNPDIAWVAAVGNLWKPSTERGIYKTTDAGRTWTRTLTVDSLTGATEIVMDPRDPNVLWGATYQRLRSAFAFNGGGPGSGLWKSTDGGNTWARVNPGHPAGDVGRIGIAISRSKPDVIIVTVEHQPGTGGTYRSENSGATWTQASRTNPRPMYFSKVYIDPANDQNVWLLGVQPSKSEDGGKTFLGMPNSPTYDLGLKDDHHVLWFDPTNSRHMLLGGDGGLHESWDGGFTYNRLNNFAVGQFYRIAVDDRDPYWIYGGLQDAHSWMGPSQTGHWLGILNSDWKQIGFSDGTSHAVDKAGPRYVYSTSSGGNITRVDAMTGDRFEIQPVAPAGESYRYDWVAPVLASMHKAGTVYLGANKLLMSKDYGSTWTATPDLTKQITRDTMRLNGVVNTDIRIARNDGETNFSEITTVAESPLDAKILWVGTDDGNVQLSQDGGKSWTELSSGISVPSGSFVDRIVASGAAKGTAYVTFDNHRSGDFKPYLFRTTDFGKTWNAWGGGFANNAPIRSIVEYPGAANVLFAGTERFLYFTIDSGRNWNRVAANLPTTRYDDLVIQQRTKDLVIATHGRSVWILDDASVFAEWTPAVAMETSHLFNVRQATIISYWADVSTAAHNIFAAENPSEGAVFSYHLAKAATSVKFSITNSSGRVVRELTGPTAAGMLHRINWDLRWPPAAGGGFNFGGGGADEAPAGPPAGGGGGGGARGGGRQALPIPAHNIGARGFYVSPGKYTVTMDVDGVKTSRSFDVRSDPSSPITLADHRARETFLLDVQDVQAKIAAATTAFRAKMSAAKGADSVRINELALKLGLVAPPRVQGPGGPAGGGGGSGGGGGGGGRGGARGPGAALGGLAGQWNGNGARHGGLQAPSGQHRAILAAAKSALAEMEKELARK